jgi:hypothetical protein
MKNLKTLTFFALSSLTFLSCDSDPWEIAHAFQFTTENVEDLHSKTFTSLEKDPLDYTQFDIYVDLSDGIAPAWGVPENKEIFKTIINRSMGHESEIITMGRPSKNAPKKDIDISESMGKGTIAELLMDPEGATDLVYAQIQENLENVIRNNREAIFISDFEEYKDSDKKEVAKTAIYSGVFENWLSKGHNLFFYRLPYSHGDKSKNLIIAAFTSSSDEGSEVNELIANLTDEHGLTPDLFFAHNPFKINFQDTIKSQRRGTILKSYEMSGHDEWSTWNLDLGYENGILLEDWNYYLDSDFQQMVKGTLSEGLLLNTQVSDFMTIENLEIRVTDISDALKLNSEINYFKELKENIELSTDKGGNVVWSANDLELELITEGIKEHSDSLLPKYAEPSFKETDKPLSLVLNKELFDDWMKNDPTKVKVHIKLNPDKVRTYYSEEGGSFSWSVKIDVSDLSLNLSLLDEYIFMDPQGNPNMSLSESLKNVSLYWEKQLLNHESRIYTYYLTKE